MAHDEEALRDYLHGWLEVQRARLQPTTWESYRGNVDRYLTPALGDLPLAALKPALLEAFAARLLTQGGRGGRPLSLRTVRFAFAVLHKALADAVRLEVLHANPCDRVALPRLDPRTGLTRTKEVRAWSADQVRTFLALTVGHPHHELWLTAVSTGLRRGELLGLRCADLDLCAPLLTVRRALTVVAGRQRLKQPKTSRVRTLRLDATTAEALRRAVGDRRRPDAPVFADAAGQHLDPMAVTLAFRSEVRRLPLPPVRLHDLRHTHATLMLSAGVPVKVVSERLGHATIALTLDIYAHVLPAMDGEAAERFAALVHGWAATARARQATDRKRA